MPKGDSQVASHSPEGNVEQHHEHNSGDSVAKAFSMEFSKPPANQADRTFALALVNGQTGDAKAGAMPDQNANPFLELGDAFTQEGLIQASDGIGQGQSEMLGGKHKSSVEGAEGDKLAKADDKGADTKDVGDEKQEWNKTGAFGVAMADLGKGHDGEVKSEADDRFFAAAAGERSLNQQAMEDSGKENPHYILDANSWAVNKNNGMG